MSCFSYPELKSQEKKKKVKIYLWNCVDLIKFFDSIKIITLHILQQLLNNVFIINRI